MDGNNVSSDNTGELRLLAATGVTALRRLRDGAEAARDAYEVMKSISAIGDLDHIVYRLQVLAGIDDPETPTYEPDEG